MSDTIIVSTITDIDKCLVPLSQKQIISIMGMLNNKIEDLHIEIHDSKVYVRRLESSKQPKDEDKIELAKLLLAETVVAVTQAEQLYEYLRSHIPGTHCNMCGRFAGIEQLGQQCNKPMTETGLPDIPTNKCSGKMLKN